MTIAQAVARYGYGKHMLSNARQKGIELQDEAAVRHYCTVGWKEAWCKQLSDRRLSIVTENKVKELRQREYSMRQIAAELGISRDTVRTYLRRLGMDGKITPNQMAKKGTSAESIIMQEYRTDWQALRRQERLRHPAIAEYTADKNREKARLAYHENKTPERMAANRKRSSDRHARLKRDPDYRSGRRRVQLNWRDVPHNRMRTNLGIRLYNAVKQIGGNKSGSIIGLLGCDIESFRVWIEKQFIGCMSWENYGRAWHIDHIVPCSYFDLTKPEDQRRCFHHSNLRPLWAKRNSRQGDRRGTVTMPLGI